MIDFSAFEVPIEMSESTHDFRRVVDMRLKEACHDLIAVTADAIVLELGDFVAKAEIEVQIALHQSRTIHIAERESRFRTRQASMDGGHGDAECRRAGIS
jgi:hypothetical protein